MLLNKIRQVVLYFKNLRNRFWSVYKKVNVGENVKINPPYQLKNVDIGSYTYLSENAKMSITSIGKFCSIGPNVVSGWGIHEIYGLSTAPMFYSTGKQNGMTLAKENKIVERKPVKIGNDVFIGANVIILDGVEIGDGAVIGAGAIVTKNIPPYAVAVGMPIKIIKYRFDQETIDKLLKIKWWDWSDEKLPEVEKMFFEVDKFIQKYGS